jgi:hypothetical protein
VATSVQCPVRSGAASGPRWSYAGTSYDVTGLDGGGFIHVGDLMTLANNALAGYTTSRNGSISSALTGYLDALEDALEAANNNSSFVQQSVS